ncbi:hypothetical protein G6F66_013912 [Rhizopus arrhizus]|nr:hypothetical protein G6F66_013912 [Rhizopus arrhizus]
MEAGSASHACSRATPVIGVVFFFGSSPNSGEGCADLEEEVGIVPVSVGYALDDLDLVVDPLDQVRPQRPSAVGHNAWQIGLQAMDKGPQGLKATAQSALSPALPCFFCPRLAAVAPELLQVVFEQIGRQQGFVCLQQFLELDALIARDILSVT